jgi:alpha-tubulin suppressor-like RCC1 family protein
MVQVDTGAYHSLALARDGTVWSWGWNAFGQLGDGTTRDRTRPVKVKGLTDVVSISSGWYHNLALKQDGTVWAWGWNFFGQIGDGTLTDRWVPVRVSGLTDMTVVSAGAYHNIGVVAHSSSMRAWGWNGFGQLGDGTLTTRTVPVPIQSPFELATHMVSAGYLHNIAMTNTGKVFGWGWNAFGQLGTGTLADVLAPRSIACNTTRPGCTYGAVWVAAGGVHSLVLDKDLSIWSYGSNVFGVLGDGPEAGRTVSERIPGSRSVLDLSAGFFHNLSVGTE